MSSNLWGPSEELPPNHLVNFPEHAQWIGMIISEWNIVEHTLIDLIAQIMHAEKLAVLRMLKTVRSSRGRLDAIEAALNGTVGIGFIRNEFFNLIELCRKALTRRNRYAHAHYYSKDGKNLMMVNPSEDGSDESIERVIPVNELKTTHADIHSLAIRAREITVELNRKWYWLN